MRILRRMIRKEQKGFTLIELLIVIGILAVVAAVAIPNLTKFMGAGKNESYDSDKQVIQTAVSSFMAEYGVYPTIDGTGDVAANGKYVVMGPATGGSTLINGATNATDTTVTVDSATNITANDYIMIGSSGSREIVQVISVAGNILTVAALANAHADNEDVIEFGLVTQGYVSEPPSSSSPDNPSGSTGHYTWFVGITGSIGSCYNSTAASSGTDTGTTDFQDGVYP